MAKKIDLGVKQRGKELVSNMFKKQRETFTNGVDELLGKFSGTGGDVFEDMRIFFKKRRIEHAKVKFEGEYGVKIELGALWIKMKIMREGKKLRIVKFRKSKIEIGMNTLKVYIITYLEEAAGKIKPAEERNKGQRSGAANVKENTEGDHTQWRTRR
jgi:hypothetical protein